MNPTNIFYRKLNETSNEIVWIQHFIEAFDCTQKTVEIYFHSLQLFGVQESKTTSMIF